MHDGGWLKTLSVEHAPEGYEIVSAENYDADNT